MQNRLCGLCHIAGAGCLFYASTATGYDQMWWAMLPTCWYYAHALSLANTVFTMHWNNTNVTWLKAFLPSVWGTIGFICAMWAVDLTGLRIRAQLYVGWCFPLLLLGLYSFTLPACFRPAKSENKSWLSAFRTDALVLFKKKKKMAIFFLFLHAFRLQHCSDYKYFTATFSKQFCQHPRID